VIVLDASALLAFLFREAGQELVAKVVNRSCLSAVNLCEVLTRFASDGHDPVEVLARIRETPIKIVPFDSEQAALAAALAPTARSRGLSLGDRACLVLAVSLGVPVLTADRAWAGLQVGVYDHYLHSCRFTCVNRICKAKCRNVGRFLSRQQCARNCRSGRTHFWFGRSKGTRQGSCLFPRIPSERFGARAKRVWCAAC